MSECAKHEGLVAEIAQLKQDMTVVKNDIRDLYQLSNSYVDRQARIEVKLDTVTTAVSDLKKEIQELAKLPGIRWNTLVTSGITAFVVGVIGIAIGKLLK